MRFSARLSALARAMKAGAIIVAILVFLCLPTLVHAQGMSAYYWGDADGNGDIGTPDVTSLTAILNNPAASDTVYYTKFPVSRYRQDTDGNGDIGAPDATILRAWLYGDFSTISGGAASLVLEATTTHVQTGSSVLIGAHALSGTAGALRTGWGVEFAIDSTSPCQTAEIYGYTVKGGDTTAGYGWYHQAYKYTAQPFAPDFAEARVKVKPTGCSVGQHIYVKVFIPSDSEAVIPGARFPTELDAPQLLDITVTSTDTTPPVTTINTFPANPTNQTGATFSFTCVDASLPCTFQCQIDGGGFSSCASPIQYSSLAQGSHTFYVKATDAVGNQETPGSSYTWSIDTTPPVTTIDTQPSNPTNQQGATFSFHCTDASQPCTFQCHMDAGIWAACTSPYHYSGLSAGNHTFQVMATDAAGNLESSSKNYSWAIDLTAPVTTIDTQPTNPTNQQGATFTFHCSDASLPCTFQCQMDGGGFSSCSSPKHYSGLSSASHTFNVKATDNAGNNESPGPSYTWTVDTIPPDTIITSNPPDPNNSGSDSFSFICDEPPCTFECNMDSSGWSACSSPKNYSAGGAESWTATSTTGAPSARYYHTAVWTGTEMIIWGGFVNTGGRYNPATDSWTATSLTNAPAARALHTAVWTGTEMIVWTGGRYNPATDSWIATSITNAPTSRQNHTAVWTGTEMIVWGGYTGAYLNTGGRYNPTTDSWIATSLTNAPAGRYYHTAVWTGSNMIIWGGYCQSWPYLTNTGGRYNPATDSWVATTGINAPQRREYHTAVWTGTEMIVWGGYDQGNTWGLDLDSGGRYNPATDSWIATSWTNAPEARQYHTAVWSGSEMIVWGGYDGSSYLYLNTGGRYNPATDSWIATSLTNAPEAREYHTAVWTGAKMIVWGGDYYNFGQYILNTGGRYSPPGTLSEGTHTFAVRAYDAALNVDPTPATYSWTIDFTPPITSLTSAPPNPTRLKDAVFEFTCNETGCIFECDLDSEGWATCSSPAQYLGLSVGDHTFSVRATDPAGNLELNPLIYPWTIKH